MVADLPLSIMSRNQTGVILSTDDNKIKLCALFEHVLLEIQL